MNKNIIKAIIIDNEQLIAQLNDKDYTDQMIIDDIIEQNEQLEALLLITK